MCLRNFNSTEPKDYVFALLGHYSAQLEFPDSKGSGLLIEANYDPSIQPKQVFHEVAIRLVRSGHVKLLNAIRPKEGWDGEFSSLSSFVPSVHALREPRGDGNVKLMVL